LFLKRTFSKKEKKGLRRNWSVFLSLKQTFSKKEKKGLRRNYKHFFVTKIAQDTSLKGGRSHPGGREKYLQGGQLQSASSFLWTAKCVVDASSFLKACAENTVTAFPKNINNKKITHVDLTLCLKTFFNDCKVC